MIKTNQNVFFLIIMLKSFYVEPAIKPKNKMILLSNSLILMKLLIDYVYIIQHNGKKKKKKKKERKTTEMRSFKIVPNCFLAVLMG